MTALFKRAVQVDLAKPVTGSLSQLQPNALTIEGLRVSFRAEKNLGKEPNSCEIAVHNLSEDTIAEFIRKPLHVRLSAGYENEGVKRLFSGDLIWSATSRPVDTRVTRLQIGDGSRRYSFARSNRSFKKGTSIKAALREVANNMGMSTPAVVESDPAFDKQFTSGVALEGLSRREMDRLVRAAGYEWSIQDGGLQILKKGGSNPVEVIPISQDTGMLGTPEFGPPAQPGDNPVLSVRTYIDGRFKPGNIILMQAEKVRGLFVIQRVLHDGDTHGAEWYSTLEAIAV